MIRRLRGWTLRLWWTWSAGPGDNSSEEELRSHLAMDVAEQVASGTPEAEARRHAMIRLGGLAQTVELAKDQQGFGALCGVWADLRLALRRLTRTPAFTAAAVVTLALGIGATSAVFSVARAGLLAPLPYPDSARRVMLFTRWTAYDKTWLADAEIMDFRRMAHTLSAIAGWLTRQQNLTGDGRPVRLTVGFVTANTFDVLGVTPQLGRSLTEADDQPHAAPVVILSDSLWRSRYGSAPGIVGRSVLLDDEPVQVVGVMPAGFKLPSDFTEDAASPSQAWRALQIDQSELSRGHGYFAAALLAPGATASSASEELGAIASQLTAQGLYRTAMRFSAFAVGFDDEIRGPVRPALWLLAGGVACLLLIACANVSNLLLVRGDAQLKELTLRRALGATPGRLRRQLGVEGIVLLSAGTLLGLPLAFALLTVPQRFDIPALNALHSSHLDWSMTLLAVAAAALTTMVFSLAPLSGDSSDMRAASVLRATSASTTAAPVRARLRRLLVFAQVAMAMLLLASAGLMIRSLDGLRRVELGFDASHLLTTRVSLPESRYKDPAQVIAFFEQLSRDAGALPGVNAAGSVRLLPLATTIGDWGLDVEGFDEGVNQSAKGDWQVITPGAFTAMGTKLLRGRIFTEADRVDSEPVAIVNETLARTYWRSPEAVVGGRIRLGSNPARPWIRVVGVVADERHNGVTGAVKEKFYIPHSQWHVDTGGNLVREAYVVMRTAGDPSLLAQPLAHLVQRMDPDLPIATPRPMTDVVAASLATTRLSGFLLVVFATVAVLLAGVGLYGVLAYIVLQRTREIGIRMALGSGPRAILGLVVRQGLSLAGAGVITGAVAMLALARVMRGLLYQVTATDPMNLVLMASLLMLVACAACLIPGLRAARMSPLVALKE